MADQAKGRTLWRYVMPEGEPFTACPVGEGEGTYKALKGPSAVVAVVGSAHVPGMVRELSRASKQDTAVAAAAIRSQLQKLLKN